MDYFRKSFKEYPGNIKINIMLTVSMVMQKGYIPAEEPYVYDIFKKDDEKKSDLGSMMAELTDANWSH